MVKKQNASYVNTAALANSAADLLSILESVPGLYLILKPDAPKFSIVAVSDAYAKATMTKRKKIVGKGLFEVFPDNPNDSKATGVQNLTASLMKVLKYKKPHEMDIQKYDIPHPQKGFEVRYWSPQNVPVLNNKKQVSYIIHSVIDVTATINAEEREKAAEERAYTQHALNTQLIKARTKLEESEQRFRAIWESVSEAIALSDENGIVLDANPAYFNLYGHKPDEIINKDFAVIFPKKQRQFARDKYKEIFNGEKVKDSLESTIVRANGTERLVESRYDFITNNGKRIAMISTVRDITERKELEKQKDDFLAVASHELKTPVTSIKAYGQVLQVMFAKEGNSKAVSQLGKMDVQIDKLTNLIADLLDVTKIHSGRLSLHRENFNFNELVENTVNELQMITTRHTLILELDKPKKIYGDKERIGQVITNLISNAIKYSPQSKKIIIKTEIVKKNITFCVQDFGVGIPKEKQERVFEQFFRVSGEKQHTFPGLGLGLFISNEIVTRLGGKMWVESTEGKGSTFYFTLPF